jgi:pimeloyl-ACP methyl ester carboxylesterase
MIAANGVELCMEPFGDPADPPVLLVMGIGGSMLWWEQGVLPDARRWRTVRQPRHRPIGRYACARGMT